MGYSTLQTWFVIATTLSFANLYSTAQLCKVRVGERSWPAPNLLVPINSIMELKCTLNNSNLPYWSIVLANDDQSVHRQFDPRGGQLDMLNENGVYELPELNYLGQSPTLGLLVNDTSKNNGTEINCLSETNEALTTSIFVYEPLPLALEATDAQNVSSISIKWDPSQFVEDHGADEVYELSVTSKNSDEELFILNTTSFTFTAPPNAPPCEVYNFSVTATPVGATYTGDGCSVPSPVFSTMLPSLPDTRELESSMNYSLTKVVRNEDTAITLTATFMPADSCVSYPVTNYTLEFTQGPVPDSLMLTSTENSVSLTAHNLMENSVYKFKVVVSNSVGNVSTSEETIYTTDLQRVVAVQTGSDSISVQCDFITGSDAQGCMVVLESEADNTTITLSITREEAYTIGTINTTRPLNCYHKVFGFDIESNGSVGTLPVPGELMVNNTNIDMCMAEQPSATASRPLWIIGVVLALMLALVVLLLMVVVCVRRKKSRYNFNPSTLRPTESQSPTDDHTYICDQSSEVRCMGIDNEKEDTDGEVQASMPVYDAPESSSGH